ncbi:hypothetical protein ACF0H5_009220 [Mactra antiquata]
MIQYLLEALIREKCIQRPHFTLLLKPQITRLDLKDAGMAANNDSVAKVVSHNCMRLVYLGLSGMNNISARALADLVSLLPELRSLDLSQTGCNDQVLSNIGFHCHALTDLNIRNTKTSNSGVFSICKACHPEQGCKKLVRFIIYGTMINFKGALHCLQNLPSLQYLGFDDTCSLVEADVQERTIQGHDNVNYRLRNIVAHGIKVLEVSEESITLACQLCEQATEARLYCDINNNAVLSVKTLKNLTKLGIGNSHTQILTFENGVLPVLREIGHQLEELTLADVNDFDLVAIGNYCRNLQSLSLLVSEDNENQLPSVTNMFVDGHHVIFSKLKRLEIHFPMSETNLQRNAFVILLKNAKTLTKVTLQYVSWLTTDIFQEVLEENPLIMLREMKLVYCDVIEGEAIKRLVFESNDLHTLNLFKCRNISRQDFEQMNKYVKKNNLNLSISWD